jgi:hypothetical protein
MNCSMVRGSPCSSGQAAKKSGASATNAPVQLPGLPSPWDTSPPCLASARAQHAEHLALLAQGTGPKKREQDAAEQEQLVVDSLFFNVASKWFAVKKTKISAAYADDIWKSLERNVFPVMGQTPVTLAA